MEKPLLLFPISAEGEESLKLYKGISDKQTEQLLAYTNTDSEIKKFTSDLTRFPDRTSFDKWEVDKFLYTLADEEDFLLGLIWFEEKDIPFEVKAEGFNPEEYKITLAIRTYGKARGKGYFTPFLKEVIKQFKATPEYQAIEKKGLWVSIAKENIISYQAFQRFGFTEVENTLPSERILMIE